MKSESTRRKWIYGGLIVALLFGLSYMGQPATVNVNNERQGGGMLAQSRFENKLDQANLGEVDPASATMKLITFGQRGLAAFLLWNQAERHKRQENWTELQATLDQLTKVQPNYIGPWRYQSWNLSYNVSVEFDDWRHRYLWVKEGIKYLLRGARFNEAEHRLVSDVGWFTGQKIGRSDERKVFREAFKIDDDAEFPAHAQWDRTKDGRDNWLVAGKYYHDAERMVADMGLSLGAVSPVIFYSSAPKTAINYAEAIEDDGRFGERAQTAWDRALAEWTDFGYRELPYANFIVRLLDLDDRARDQREALAKLEKLTEGLETRIKEAKEKLLTPAQRAALEKKPSEMNELEREQAMQAMAMLQVSVKDMADQYTGPERDQVIELATNAARLQEHVAQIGKDREQCEFEYWQTRCKFEGLPETIEARRLTYEGAKLKFDNDREAKKLFEEGFAQWRKAYDLYPKMAGDSAVGDDLLESVDHYLELLNSVEQTIVLPEDFVLMDVIRILRPPPPMGGPPGGPPGGLPGGPPR